MRRLKYRPAGGFCLFSLADAIPAVTWSLLGHDRTAKLAYHVVAEACRPVIVVADRMPAAVAPGETLALDVHVVSDRREPIEGAHHLGRPVLAGRRPGLAVAGDIPADGCVRVGTVQVVVPATSGRLVLDLDLVAGDDAVTNRYESLIS